MAETTSGAALTPADWVPILDEVSRKLADALAAADAQAERLAAPPSEAAHEARQNELAQLAEGMHGLAERARQAEGLVAAVDQALQDGEGLLRQHLAATEAARQKLADWVVRAIG